MDDNTLLMFLCLCFYKTVLATGQNESEYCYRIKPASVSAVVIGDVVLTVLIVIAVYRCASQRRKRREEADKVYMNVRANCKA